MKITEKAKKKLEKAHREIEKIKEKIQELEQKALALKEQNKALKEEIGTILAKVNLGELPEDARKEAEKKRKQMESNELELEGIRLALESLRERLEEKQKSLKGTRVEVYLGVRERVIERLEKELKRYNEMAQELAKIHAILHQGLNWLSNMEHTMQAFGYKPDRKPEAVFGDLLRRPSSRPSATVEVLQEVNPGHFEYRVYSPALEEALKEEGLEFLAYEVNPNLDEARKLEAVDAALGLK